MIYDPGQNTRLIIKFTNAFFSGRVLCEGKEFGQDETFLLYSPTSHHAIEIVPLQLDVQIMFKRIKPLPIEEGINSQLFPPADWAKGNQHEN